VNGESREFPILQRLIRTGKSLAGREAQLQDPGFAVEDLLQT
jgi:hypothetical protein